MRGIQTAARLLVCIAAGMFFFAKPSFGQSPPLYSTETVTFRGGSGLLHAYLFKPLGNDVSKEPLPAIIFYPNLRRELLKSAPATEFDKLALFWTKNGYVVFIPDHEHRRWAPEEEAVAQNATTEAEDPVVVELHTVHKDVAAATSWLKSQAFVDSERIVMGGTMFGGSHTILCAETGMGLKAFIPFSPATASWKTHPMLQNTLRRGIRNAKAPIFLIQTQNDASLAPTAILGKELAAKGKPNLAKVYPPFGKSNADARNFAVQGVNTWGPDVLKFLKDVLPE